MADPTNLKKLQTLVEKIEHDAYQRGWRDATNRIVKSATDAVKAVAPQKQTASTPQVASRATRGSVPPVVKTILTDAGQTGVTAAEAYKRAREIDHDMVSASIRATLCRFVAQGIARKVGKRWFLTETDNAPPMVIGGASNSAGA